MVYHLKMNVNKDQSRYKQGSANWTDFHTYMVQFFMLMIMVWFVFRK